MAVDLYEVLSLSKDATPADIKAAYRRAALASHPDKLPPAATVEVVEAANTKFQQVGLAYAVLKDEKRRERYDATGETDEGSGLRSEAEWKDYFRELWTGEVNAKTLDEFKEKYQGSEEEQADLFAAYTNSKGDLETILSSVMCSTVDDEDRFVALINDAIAAGSLTPTPSWKKAIKDTKAKERRRAKATKEATEAEEYARELGVHDKLFGDKTVKNSKGGKGKGKQANDDPDASLRALIQGNSSKRMESMLESLEAKYGAKEKENASKRGRKKRAVGDDTDDAGSGKNAEPSEEEFLRIQAEVDARRAKKLGESEPPSKRGKKTKA